MLLDFGGTLASGGMDWDPYHESIRNYLLTLGFNINMQKLRRTLRGTLAELERYRSTGMEKTFEEVYAEFLTKLGIPSNDYKLEWLHENFKAHYRTSFYPCVEDVLKTLSLRYKLALVSNTMSDQPKLLLKKANMDQYFSLLVCSRDLGVRKPNPEIFRIVMHRLGVKPYETVHVGDSVEADMIGAQRSGITGIWIKSPEQPPWSGYAVKTICELPKLLETLDMTL
ncbi:MAG: HAD family hydrolase [Armatimonadetes bacterium]|nr:HAD family hydrolase [Armatimonadota bacterium]